MGENVIILLQKGVYAFGIGISYIFCPRIIRILKNFGNIFYTGWVKRGFKRYGNDSMIEYPIILFGKKYISIGNNFETRGRLRIEAFDNFKNHSYNPEIIIKDNVSFNYDCHLGAINKIVIGNNVLIGSRVLITDHFHGLAQIKFLEIPPKERKLISKGPIFIEDNVWIGEGAVIMPNVTIGMNSIIGANAVVTKNVPKNCYAVGVPAEISHIRNNINKTS